MQFSTLITLTVATSMAVLFAMAAPTGPKCGTGCPAIYQPICAKAVDGLNKVFVNACELKNFNCKHPNANFAVVAESDCKDFVAVDKRGAAAATPKCDTICPTVYQPVCARAIDGLNKAFGNACELKNYNCKHPNANFVTIADSECKDIPTPTPVCNKVCPLNYEPVCVKIQSGESKTFGNVCELNMYKCEHPTDKIELLASAECAAASPACAIACPAVYKPVCAKHSNGDLRTFGNKCELSVFNCKNPANAFSLVTEGDCVAK